MTSADKLLAEPLIINNYRLWFCVIVESFPVTLEINTRERRLKTKAVRKLTSTNEEIYLYSKL